MAIIIPNGFVQITIPFKHASLNREAVITYGAEVGGSGATPAELDAHLGLFTGATTNDNNLTMGPVRGSFGTAGGEHLSVTGTTVATGTSSGERLPANCAVLVKKTSARGGRRGRGRMYFPWRVLETDVSETGAIDSADVAAMQSEYSDWLADLVVSNRSMYLLHDDEGSTAPGSPDLVTGLQVDSVIATQRRRLGR